MSDEENNSDEENSNEEPVDEDALAAAEWAAALEQQEAEETASQDGADELMGQVQNAELEQLQGEGEPLRDLGKENPNLEVVLDIPVTLSMEVGNTEISIRNLLQLNQGSVIELDRLAGEALDVLVNGTLVAHGEVVVVNEKFGIRLTDIVSPGERIQRLN